MTQQIKIISHRGNLEGPNPSTENTPKQIELALKKGFDVEVDVWKIDDKWFLGHDKPEHEIDFSFLFKDFLWIHTKNIAALEGLKGYGLNYFWHQNDDYTITSRGVVWTYPGKVVPKTGVALFFEKDMEIPDCKGICVDHALDYAEKLWLKQ